MFIDYKLDHTVDNKESSLRTSLGSEICADALIHCNWEKKRSKQSDKEINRSLSFSHISDVNLMIIISFYYIVLCPLLSCPCTSLHHSKGTSTSIRLWSSRRTVGETSKQTVSFSFSSSVYRHQLYSTVQEFQRQQINTNFESWFQIQTGPEVRGTNFGTTVRSSTQPAKLVPNYFSQHGRAVGRVKKLHETRLKLNFFYKMPS